MNFSHISIFLAIVLGIVGAYHAILVPHEPLSFSDEVSSVDTSTALAQLGRKIKENELAKIANAESITVVTTKTSSLQSEINSLVSKMSSVENFIDGFNSTTSADTSSTVANPALDARIASVEAEIDSLEDVDETWKRKIALLEFQQPIQKLEIDGMVTRTDAMLGTMGDLASTVNEVSILASTYEERANELITNITNDANILSDSLTERFATLSNQLISSSGAIANAIQISGVKAIHQSEEIIFKNLGSHDTHFRLNSNYISTGEGNATYFRFGTNNPSVAITQNEVRISSTNVLETLISLEARISDIEGNYVDTRKTQTLYNHVAQKYLSSGGDVNTDEGSFHARWSVRNR